MYRPIKALAVALAIGVAGTAPALAEDRLIGLAAPLEGSNQLLGRQMRDGASLAAARAGAEIMVVDTDCTANGGASAARAFVARQADAVVGFLCTEAIEAALPILSGEGIPVITSGVRTDSVTDRREREGWLVWRLGPRADDERAAVSDILPRLWREALFAIVDDGTIYGRELAESFRLAAELAGLQPVFVDTYRPQSDNQIGLVGRLKRAGATHVFVGGDRDDIAIMARDAASLDYQLTIAGGEALRAQGDVALTAGTLMIGLPERAEMIDEGGIERFSEASIIPEGYVVPTYAATEVALAAIDMAGDGGSAADILDAHAFDTIVGPVSFDDQGDLDGNPFQLLRYDGERFLPVE
jgi:branched-chain amino acid transport system substrate-binding protein